jgi:hypothetical protein
VEDVVGLKSCPEWGRGITARRGRSPALHPGREPIRGENVSTGSTAVGCAALLHPWLQADAPGLANCAIHIHILGVPRAGVPLGGGKPT